VNTYDEDDFCKSIIIVDKFFEDIIITNLNNWSSIIKIDRKGSIIFNEQAQQREALRIKYNIRHTQIDQNGSILKNGSTLIFDDSIEDGDTITPILKKLVDLNLKKITVSILLARKDSLEKLKEDFPEVVFISAMTVNKDCFTSTREKTIWPYLDYVCLPIQDDHPLIVVDFLNDLQLTELNEFFSAYGKFSIDGSLEKYIDLHDRFKGSIELNMESLKNVLTILNESQDVDEIRFKLRIYFRHDEMKNINKLILQPIGLEIPEIVDRVQLENEIVEEFLINNFIFRYLSKIDKKIARISVVYH
jgi:hypothetical protein